MTPKDVVLETYRAFADRDPLRLESLCHPNIEWHQNPGFPGGGIHIGIRAILEKVFEANARRWTQFEFQIHAVMGEDNKVLVEGAYLVRGKPRQEVAVQTAHVFNFEGGRIRKFQQYSDTKTLWDQLEA